MVIDGEERVKEILLKKLGKGKKQETKKQSDEGDEWFKEHYLGSISNSKTLKNKFGIVELKSEEIKKLPEGLKRFTPYACKNCGYDKKIPRRVFKIKKIPKNTKEANELKRYMKRKYNIYYFKLRSELGITTLNSGKCPRCDSQYVMFNYGIFIRKPATWK